MTTFAPGRSENSRGPYESSRQRARFSNEFIAALLRDFRHGGPKAIERVRRTQPASYLKICALMIPREMKIEIFSGVNDLSDEELESVIAALKAMLVAQGSDGAKIIDGSAEPAALPAPEAQPIGAMPEPKFLRRQSRLMIEADTAIGPREHATRKCLPRT